MTDATSVSMTTSTTPGSAERGMARRVEVRQELVELLVRLPDVRSELAEPMNLYGVAQPGQLIDRQRRCTCHRGVVALLAHAISLRTSWRDGTTMSSNPATTPSDLSVRASVPSGSRILPPSWAESQLTSGAARRRVRRQRGSVPRGRSGRSCRYWLGGRRGRASHRPLVRYGFRSPSWRGPRERYRARRTHGFAGYQAALTSPKSPTR